MKAIDIIERLVDKSIINSDLKYCLVDENKHPFTVDGIPARPNKVEDFVSFDRLIESKYLQNFAGIGISIQASNIYAIDVDHCFSIPNNIESGDQRALYFLETFKNLAYCEFSFSGTGLRIIFKSDIIDDYSNKYYIKNEKHQVEYYQPGNSFRYVTVTGNSIYNNNINKIDKIKLQELFLDKYMVRPTRTINVANVVEKEERSFEDLMKMVRVKYLRDMTFQNLWFNKAPGSGKDESERDYHLVAYLYENVTQDKDMIKKIFEQSDFFKTKDWKHVCKWKNQDYRYFNYIYGQITNCVIKEN